MNCGLYIIAICAGSMVLHEAGVLKKKVVTSYPGFEDKLGEIERYSENKVIRDKNIITSRGPETANLLAYCLIELFKDSTIRKKIEEETLYRL